MTSVSDTVDIVTGAVASFFAFSGRLIARAILMIMAGRVFGMEALGLLGVVAAIIEITAAIASLGLKRGLLEILSEDERNGRPDAYAVIEALIVALSVATVLSTGLYLLWPHISSGLTDLRPLLFLAIPFTVLGDVCAAAIRHRRIIKWEVKARGFVEPWTFLGFAICLQAVGIIEGGLIVAYVGSIIAAGIMFSIGLIRVYSLRKLFERAPSWKRLRALPKRSLPFGITDLGVMMFRRVDILILGIFVSSEITGIYYIIQQLATIPQKVNVLFEPMTGPVVARLNKRQDYASIRKHILGVCRWVLLLQLGITVPMICFGDVLLSAFGPGFAIGITALGIILIAELIDGVFITVETPLLFGRPSLPPILVSLALVIEVTAIAIGANQAGLVGGALGFLAAMSVLAALRLIKVDAYLGQKLLDRSFIGPILLATGFAIVLLVLRAVPVLPLIPTAIIATLFGIIVYLAVARAYTLTRSDKIALRSFRRRRQLRQST